MSFTSNQFPRGQFYIPFSDAGEPSQNSRRVGPPFFSLSVYLILITSKTASPGMNRNQEEKGEGAARGHGHRHTE